MKEKKSGLPGQLKLGFAILLVLIFCAVFAPQLCAFTPTDFTDELLEPPSALHPFGTDGIGRDVFSMVIYGTRTSLPVGVTAAAIAMVIGTGLGALAGYYGSWFDRIFNEIINIFLMLPTFFLIIMVIALFGSGIEKVTLVIGLTSWMGTAKIMNAQVKSLKERSFIQAAKVMGESDAALLLRYMVPHGLSPVLANVSASVSSAILYEASLSFLGLGDPSRTSWGQIIYNGKQYMNHGWWIAGFAGLAIVLTMFAFHLISEGINRSLEDGGRRA